MPKLKVMPLMPRMPPNLQIAAIVELESIDSIHQLSMLAQLTWDTASKTTHNQFADNNNAHQSDMFQFVDNRQLDFNLHVLMSALDLQWEL